MSVHDTHRDRPPEETDVAERYDSVEADGEIKIYDDQNNDAWIRSDNYFTV